MKIGRKGKLSEVFTSPGHRINVFYYSVLLFPDESHMNELWVMVEKDSPEHTDLG